MDVNVALAGVGLVGAGFFVLALLVERKSELEKVKEIEARVAKEREEKEMKDRAERLKKMRNKTPNLFGNDSQVYSTSMITKRTPPSRRVMRSPSPSSNRRSRSSSSQSGIELGYGTSHLFSSCDDYGSSSSCSDSSSSDCGSSCCD